LKKFTPASTNKVLINILQGRAVTKTILSTLLIHRVWKKMKPQYF